MARGLFRLEEIRVSRCKTMDEMVSQGLEEIKEDGDDTVNVPLFPELKCHALDSPALADEGGARLYWDFLLFFFIHWWAQVL